jgi:hypothetical protein
MSHPLSEYSDEEIDRIRYRCLKCDAWMGEKHPGDSDYCYSCEIKIKKKKENSRLKNENERLKLELENIKLKKEIAKLKNMVKK